ncbi:MAG: dTDP-4-dehydrorhamnose 3,5-epimerase [Saprospiraceae bacterium]|nr:dTDP-4-dehydrorhamnose 3,5-epimerase [Saprospiraceae bacterium]
MELTKTYISGLFVVDTKIVSDERGYFYRAWESNSLLIDDEEIKFVQYNISHNHTKGTVRGMHMQLSPFGEIKLVRCIKGKVYDVAVDLRVDSATFMKFFGIELSEDNGKALLIPEGCAHGFQTMENETTLLYMHSNMYDSSSEFSISYKEPKVNIQWPLEITQISDKDRSVLLLDPKNSTI